MKFIKNTNIYLLFLIFNLIIIFSPLLLAQNAWINEIHYKGETQECIEIVIENSHNYNLSDFKIDLYYEHGSTSLYASTDLSTFTNGGTYNSNMTIFFKFIRGIDDGLKNNGSVHHNFGAGIALGYKNSLIQFITYNGTFIPHTGIAANTAPTDTLSMNTEAETDASGSTSLQLIGDGNQYSDFVWQSNIATTWGAPNNGGDQSLPVELSELTAQYKDRVIILNWKTSSETENAGFNVYRSISDQSSFVKVNNELIVGAGNTTQSQSYRYEDRKIITGYRYYYKIEDVSFANEKKFSPIISVDSYSNTDSNQLKTFRITNCYPNPFNPFVNIQFEAQGINSINIIIYNLNGQIVRTIKNVKLNSNRGKITWNGRDNSNNRVSSGVYFIKISSGSFYDQRKIFLLR